VNLILAPLRWLDKHAERTLILFAYSAMALIIVFAVFERFVLKSHGALEHFDPDLPFPVGHLDRLLVQRAASAPTWCSTTFGCGCRMARSSPA
jgi:hypothetical protein